MYIRHRMIMGLHALEEVVTAGQSGTDKRLAPENQTSRRGGGKGADVCPTAATGHRNGRTRRGSFIHYLWVEVNGGLWDGVVVQYTHYIMESAAKEG